MEFILVDNPNESSLANRGKAPYEGGLLSDEKLGRILGKGILSFYFDAIKVTLHKPSWLKTALTIFKTAPGGENTDRMAPARNACTSVHDPERYQKLQPAMQGLLFPCIACVKFTVAYGQADDRTSR